MAILNITYRFRRGYSSDWAEKNTVLQAGEPGHEVDTDNYKIGDGYTPWLDLPYYQTAEKTRAAIEAAIADLVVDSTGVTQEVLDAHVNSETPHPVYDDGPSFLLLYQNAKV